MVGPTSQGMPAAAEHPLSGCSFLTEDGVLGSNLCALLVTYPSLSVLSIGPQRRLLSFSLPGSRPSSRRGYSRSEPRISLVLGLRTEQNLTRHARPA
jgi:hypothetical protein